MVDTPINDNPNNLAADIHLLSNLEQDKVQAALEGARRSMTAMIEYQQIIAKIRHASYMAHIDAGFTPEQAVLLCTRNLL